MNINSDLILYSDQITDIKDYLNALKKENMELHDYSNYSIEQKQCISSISELSDIIMEKLNNLSISSSDSILHPVTYLSLGAGSVILSTVIMYACFSNFFHKKPAATFNKWQKFMWFIIAALIMSAALIILCYFVPTWIS